MSAGARDAPGPAVRRTGRYHHGNLREALLVATLALVRERGPAGFTLKDAAAAAGVSAAAPYRHFPDREHLLAAAATGGYAELLRRLSAVDEPEPAARLARLMTVFVEWALADPATHRILFASGLDKTAHAELTRLSEAAVALFTVAALGTVADQVAARRLMVSAFAIAQGHAGIVDDPAVASAGSVTPADIGPLTHAAVLALARATQGTGQTPAR